MYKAIVFAGTTEGYQISRFLAFHKISVLACVATEYGTHSLEEDEFLHVKAGRLAEEEMRELFQKETPKVILDGTHPYAKEVTDNISKAAARTGIPYIRILRDSSAHKAAVYVDSTEKAAEYLEETEGNVLLTTGSKELKVFTEIPSYRDRLYARVLSLPSVVETCSEYGFEGKHLIAMQGPFSREMNEAMLRQYQCSYLVTKDSGKAGGFEEKIQAAEACGVIPVVIGRPEESEKGISLKECKHKLMEIFGFQSRPQITLLGIGMGNPDLLTVQAKKKLEEAELVIGARRMADSVKLLHHDVFYEYRSEEIRKYIEEHPEYSRIVVALSGDVGFYSGARKLLDVLGKDTEVICGISSVVYFMSRIGLSWDDARIVSVHGKNCNLVSEIRTNKKVFAILGKGDSVAELAGKLTSYGMGEVLLYVGESLSYENEKIFSAKASELTEYQGDPLSVLCAVNPSACEQPATHGLADEEFIRGKAPMTKTEVRTVSLGKLKLQEDSICYDIGAGTGSVSVEMALRARAGSVYAVEKKDEAVALLRDNKKKFALDHMTVVQGLAPEALKELPVPTHAFIGGSSGNLKEIVTLLLSKNPEVRMVINCITLETVGEALDCIRTMEKEREGYEWETEVVQLVASRSKNIGRYHMMMGENPIYIITIQAHKNN